MNAREELCELIRIIAKRLRLRCVKDRVLDGQSEFEGGGAFLKGSHD